MPKTTSSSNPPKLPPIRPLPHLTAKAMKKAINRINADASEYLERVGDPNKIPYQGEPYLFMLARYRQKLEAALMIRSNK